MTGQDIDEFDGICDHLIVEHAGTGKIVGTYRLQTGAMASANAGFYSEREFDFSPYRQLGSSVIELGRACVHRDHRTSEVLYLLWHGIAQYAIYHGGRYLIGCSSLTSQDPAHDTAVYEGAIGGVPPANHAAARLRDALDVSGQRERQDPEIVACVLGGGVKDLRPTGHRSGVQDD